MQAKAVLVLYEPQYKLKNNKFLLSLGPNIVGSDYKCQVKINSKKYFPQQYVANFYVTQDFMYLEALCDNMVQLKSNMQIQSSNKKKDHYKFIQKSCRYVVPMEEIFYIGPYKAIVQVLPENELRNINKILNKENFQTPKGNQEQQWPNQWENPILINKINSEQKREFHKIQQEDLNNFDAKSDRTEKIPSQNDQFHYQATLVIDDNDPFNYEPTLCLDQNHSLQSPVMNKIRQNSQSISHNLNHNLHIPSPMRSPRPSSQQSRSNSCNKELIKRPSNNSQQIIPAQISQFSDISMFSNQRLKKRQPFSQEILYQTIKKEEYQLKKEIQNHSKSKNEEQQSENFSMPETIHQNFQQKQQDQKEEKNSDHDESFQMPQTLQQGDGGQMPPTIQQGPHKSANRESDDEQMPATILQDCDIKTQKFINRKSMFQKKVPSSLQQDNKKLFKSQKIKRQAYQQQEINDIFNLFGQAQVRKVDSRQLQIQQKKQTKKINLFKQSQNWFKNQVVLPHVKIQEFNIVSTKSMNNSKQEQNQDLQNTLSNIKNPTIQKTSNSNFINKNSSEFANSLNSLNSSNGTSPRKRLFKECQKLKLVNISGFKIKTEDKITLRKRGYQIVPEAKVDDYDLLIIGNNSKATPKLLLALIQNKNIVSEDWLKCQDWQDLQNQKIQGTIEGISWQLIEKQRGKNDVFKNTGTYYLTQEIKEYHRVFESAGGMMTTQLNKRKKTNIIINCESKQDKEFYQQSKNSKNWKFYSHKLIGQSILIGQPRFQKYIVDGTSF